MLDYRALKPHLAGTLACGFRPDSRILMKTAGMDVPFPQMIMMRATDELSMIRWFMSRDGKDGVNRPRLLTQMFSEDYTESENDGYDTPEEFMRSYYGE